MLEEKIKKIIISKNYNNINNINKNNGLIIIANEFEIYTPVNDNNVYNQQIFNNRDLNIIKNKIILCYKTQNTDTSYTFNLLTKYNLKNNIKYFYYYKNGPRIIFKKSNVDISNDLYLIKTKSHNESTWSFNLNGTNKTYDSDKANEKIININFNLYEPYKNSDYYGFRFRDFMTYNDFSNNRDKYKFEILNQEVTLEKISINKKKKLEKFFSIENDINIGSLYTTNDYKKDNNLIYNKYPNITKFSVKFLKTNYEKISDSSINFEIIKRPNIYSNKYGKILFNKDYTYINTSLFANDIKNHINLYKDNKIYLSLGNNRSGITENNIYKNMKFTLDFTTKTKIKKIFFSNKIVNNFSNNYKNYIGLLDYSYNNYETNITKIIHNLPFDKITERTNKVQDISLINFFPSITYGISYDGVEFIEEQPKKLYNNIFYKELLNYKIFENTDFSFILDPTYISSNDSDEVIKYIEFQKLKTRFNNNQSKFFLKINNNIDIFEPNNNIDVKLYLNKNDDNSALIKRTSRDNINNILNNLDETYSLTYNFSNNYNIEFYSSLLLSFIYDEEDLNFYKISISNYYKTLEGGLFKNVDCIFRYYEPGIDSSAAYPNSNIYVIDNINLDTLNKVIELLPNAESSTANSIFIPSRNGSNLSKKRIQGLIGFGKEGIAKLLAIEPYNDNFRIGRGFNNQFNLNDGTLDPSNLKLTNDEVVALKYNSQKHISQKQNNNITNKNNFADLVRNSYRSRNINLNSPSSCSNGPPTIPKQQYYTPFRMFKTNKGNYLRSGK